MRLNSLLVAGIASLSAAVSAQDFNYGEALQKSLLFYEAQQSGVLPEWNRISWRGDSGVNDGADVGLDLTGGWHDAGDHIKFGFPMAFSVSALNWGFLEYKDGYDAAGQTEHFKQNIKWVTDYFIKCHPSANEFYAQISFKGQDHNYWMPAEMVDVHPMYGQRESYKLDVENPGTDVACETAAAMASASIIFKDSDPEYSDLLLDHAIELYAFGDSNRGTYTGEGNIPAVGTYTSGGYEDELVWGALWLYKATGDNSYLVKAEQEYTEPDYLWSLAWDDKRYANMVILAQLTDKQNYKDNCERHLQFWMDDDAGVAYSPGGQAHLTQWGSLRHSMNAALVALIYSDSVETENKQMYYDFALSQVRYILGDNPLNRSFLMGFGNNPPTKPHHRGQHSSWLRSETLPAESRHELYGALIGGPGAADDGFEEDRSDFQENEVATDYNACFQGVLARMVMDFGGDPLPNFPQPEEVGQEFLNEAKVGQDSENKLLVNIYLNNRTGWPARVPETLSARYFVDVSEGLGAGFAIEDYQLSVNGTSGSLVTNELQEWDADNNIFYAEVEVNEGFMPFPGGLGEYRTEIQLNIELPSTSPSNAWDPSNDFSFQGLTEELVEYENIPIYANGVLAGGNEPAGADTPIASFTASVETGLAPLTVDFDASASSDPNGDNLTYAWDFDNGTTSTSESPSVTFNAIGVYEVSLTVSDGENTSREVTKTITVTDSKPILNYEVTSTSTEAPYQVTFDASSSIDPTGNGLTYAWNFGNGDSAATAIATASYNSAADYSVQLSATNTLGETTTTTFTVSVTAAGDGNCNYDTPIENALPSINEEWLNIFVLGEGGPEESIFKTATVNWDLANKGLYNFSFNYYESPNNENFSNNATHNFDTSSPEITISGSAVNNLNGTYYVTIHEGNFVMVSKTGGFTLYFSKTAAEPECISSGGITLSTPELDKANYDFSMYPNPVSELLTLSLEAETSLPNTIRSLNIISISGKVVQSLPLNSASSNQTIDVSNLAKGIYLLQVLVDGESLIVEKLVVN